ncbi:MAG: hypothetical protein AAB037_05905 [Chloroflexota bacterium]
MIPRIVCPPWCDRCQVESEDSKLLNELAHAASKSLQDLLRDMRLGHHPNLRDQATDNSQQRTEERNQQLKEAEENLRHRQEELSLSATQELLEGQKWQEVAKKILDDKLRQHLEEEVLSLKTQNEGMNTQDIEKALKQLVDKGYLDLEGGKLKVTPQ